MEPKVEEELNAFANLSAQFNRDLDGNQHLASSIVWHLIRLAHHAEQRLELEVHRPRGWSWAGFRIMVNTLALGSSEPSQLADILGVTRPTVTSNLDRLERDGLLVRETDPTNRRRTKIFLTAKGRAAVKGVMPAHMQVEAQYVAGISLEQQAQLGEMLHSLLRSLQI